MTFRFLGLAAAALLALGTFQPGQASASPVPTTPAIAGGTTMAPGPTTVQFRGDYYGGPYYRPGGYWYGGPRWYGGPSVGFSFEFGPRRYAQRYHYGPRRYYRSPCWQARSVWTPYGYRYRRVWVCN